MADQPPKTQRSSRRTSIKRAVDPEFEYGSASESHGSVSEVEACKVMKVEEAHHHHEQHGEEALAERSQRATRVTTRRGRRARGIGSGTGSRRAASKRTRRGVKVETRDRSQSYSSDMSDQDLPSSSDSNVDYTSGESNTIQSYSKYKVLFQEGRGYGIVGIQCTDVNEKGEPQKPIVVHAPDTYQRKPLPKEILADPKHYWKNVKKVLGDMFCGKNPMKTKKGHLSKEVVWFQDPMDINKEWEILEKKYKGFHMSHLQDIFDIRRGFLKKLDNAWGRHALYLLIRICRETLGYGTGNSTLFRMVGVMNGGGGASGHHGNTTIRRFNAKQEFDNDQEAMHFLEKCSTPKVGYKQKCDETKVPDVQTFDTRTYQAASRPDEREGSEFDITGWVKGAGSKSSHKQEILQTWLQSLHGLDKSDTTYGLLLTPSAGHIMELKIIKPGTRNGYSYLVTKEKTWCFEDRKLLTADPTHDRFKVTALIEFMEAVVDILYRSAESRVDQPNTLG